MNKDSIKKASPLGGTDGALYAAIAMALYEYQGNNVHDKESGIITIKPKQTMWDAKYLSFTKLPR